MNNNYQEKFGYPAERTRARCGPLWRRGFRILSALAVLCHGDQQLQRRLRCIA